MNKRKELIKQTAIILLAKVSTQLISFLMLPLYTSVLTTRDYGVVDLITTYSTLAIPLVGFQLEMGAFRYLVDNRKNENNKTIIITNTLITIFASLLFFSAIYLLSVSIINIPHRWLILTSTIAMLLSNYFLQVARGLGDNSGYSIGSIITGISTVVINLFLLLVLHMGISGILIATTIANIICIVFLTIREKIPRYLKMNAYHKKEVARLLRYSAPLVPNSLIWWIINVSDRTIISIFMDMAANGIYAVANKFSNVISQVYGVFNLSWTESAALHINDNDRDKYFSDTFNTTIKTFTCMSLLMLAFMPVIFKIMVGESYGEAFLYIPILIIGMIFNIIVSFMGAIYIAKKKTKEVALTSFWSGILNIFINASLIKTVGIWAAALSTLLAFTIMASYRYYDVQKYVKLKLDKKLAVILTALLSVCILLYYMNNTIAMIINIIIVALASIYINRGVIKVGIKAIRVKLLG